MSRYKECFRRLIKSSHVAFRGDKLALTRSRELLRTEFLKNKDEFRSEYLEKMYKDVDEVDEMLRFHLVQGHRETPEGNFDVKLRSEHLITIESEQDNPSGPSLEPIDPSYVGKDVNLHKSASLSLEERQKAKRLLEDQFNKDS